MKDKVGAITKTQFLGMEKEAIWTSFSNMAAQVDRLQSQVAELRELLRLRALEKYTPSSEQMQFLFPELEAYCGALDQKAGEEAKVDVKAHRKARTKPRDVSSLPADTPVLDIRHDQDAPDSYTDKDGIRFVRSGCSEVYKVAYVPARYVVERHIYPRYEAVCGDVAPVTGGISHKLDTVAAAPSFIAKILISKLDDHLPFYRQEEIFAREGLRCIRQKMAMWAIACYEALIPMERLFRKRICQAPYIQKDETPVQILDVRGGGGKPSTNQFMHVTVSSTWDREERTMHNLVLYQYKDGRSMKVVDEDLRGYGGYLGSDGLASYNVHPEDRHCICWVHAARHFKNALKADKDNPDARNLVWAVGRLHHEQNVWWDKLVSGEVGEEEFLAERKEACSRWVRIIIKYCDMRKLAYTGSGSMGKGFRYVLEHQDRLANFLDLVEGVPNQSAVERAIRPFAVGRHNWLFFQSVDGADASAFFYSLIESAKLMGLNPYDYLEAVLDRALDCSTDADWEALLPWNIDLKGIQEARRLRLEAVPDPDRKTPYHLTGDLVARVR